MPLSKILDRWAHKRPSEILSHEGRCCENAKSWFLAMAHSALVVGEEPHEPAWIVQRYVWGPSVWPLHWCEAMTAESMDCGALAALSRLVLEQRGVSVCPVQLIERYSVDDGAHWSALWAAEGRRADWSEGGLTYHEAVGLLNAGSLQVWDSTRSIWRAPSETQGYGSIAAIRCWAHPESSVAWGDKQILSGSWCELA